MATLIRHGHIVPEIWQRLDDGGAEALSRLAQPDPGFAGVLVPLALWLDEIRFWDEVPRTVGLILRGDDDPKPLVPDLERLAVVAIDFARFSDGRGYSIARLLRDRYRYRGEIRAVGDVLREQLFYLNRVGFDAFELRADQDAAAALAALQDFSEGYQASADRPLPLFRRRMAA
jgi:uncharacterized protein (DUF934 family)